jgi:hypothetical protein
MSIAFSANTALTWFRIVGPFHWVLDRLFHWVLDRLFRNGSNYLPLPALMAGLLIKRIDVEVAAAFQTTLKQNGPMSISDQSSTPNQS